MSTDTLDRMLWEMRPAEANHVDDWFSPAERQALLHEIMSVARPTREPPQVRRRQHVHHRRLLLPLAVAAAAAIAVITTTLPGGTKRAQAVTFRTTASSEIIATVTNPLAAEKTLDAAFAAHGLHITVNLVPVSPSLVGTVVYTSDAAGSNGIQPLQNGSCLSGGGACPVGLKIPTDFSGQGYITLGRQAQAGETYDSTASAFAPGEALRCSGLFGAKVSSATPVLSAHGLTVAQWRTANQTIATPAPSNYIWQIDPVTATTVRIWTEPTPPPTTSVSSSYSTGCAS